MRYESMSYDEIERAHTADPDNPVLAVALAKAAVTEIEFLEGEIEELRQQMKSAEEEHGKVLDKIRDLTNS